MDGVRVRPATPDDRDAALRLAPRLCEGVASWRDPAAVEQAVAGWVRDRFDQLVAESAQVFVAEHDGAVVGFAAVESWEHWTGDRDADLGELVVDPAVEGRGVGRALVEAAAGWAREQGLTHLTLATGAANLRARTFYAQLGFAEEDVRLTLPMAPKGAIE